MIRSSHRVLISIDGCDARASAQAHAQAVQSKSNYNCIYMRSFQPCGKLQPNRPRVGNSPDLGSPFGQRAVLEVLELFCASDRQYLSRFALQQLRTNLPRSLACKWLTYGLQLAKWQNFYALNPTFPRALKRKRAMQTSK